MQQIFQIVKTLLYKKMNKLPMMTDYGKKIQMGQAENETFIGLIKNIDLPRRTEV